LEILRYMLLSIALPPGALAAAGTPGQPVLRMYMVIATGSCVA